MASVRLLPHMLAWKSIISQPRPYVLQKIGQTLHHGHSLRRSLSSNHAWSLALPDMRDTSHAFYNYTSGGWLYNHKLRLQERHLVFDVHALLDAVAISVGRPSASITNIDKIAKGGSYRVFKIAFSDGPAVIARLPYPCTIPRRYAIASEVATLRYLRQNEIPVPEVLDWSTTTANAVGSEYIIMSKAEGTELEESWYSMPLEQRSNVMHNIVKVESKLSRLEFPASGSIYLKSFLGELVKS